MNFVRRISMGSHRTPSAPAGGAGSGGSIQVPAPSEPAPSPGTDLSHLSQAERAERALAESRREKETSIERALLTSALDLRQTLRVIVSAMVPRLADWCFVDLIDGDGIPRRVEVAHADPAKTPLAQEMRSISFGAGWATPAAQAMRDRSPRLLRDFSEELMHWATHDEHHLAILRAIKPNSLLTVPLVARDRGRFGNTVAVESVQIRQHRVIPLRADVRFEDVAASRLDRNRGLAQVNSDDLAGYSKSLVEAVQGHADPPSLKKSLFGRMNSTDPLKI